MIVLDTNVISEMMRPSAERSTPVVEWLRTVRLPEIATTAITVAEIAVGVNKLPEGRRRSDLRAGAARVFTTYFYDRIMPFDAPAAERYGELVADRRRRGRHFHTLDFQILAIAASRGWSVATRDTTGFDKVGVPVINPWDHPAP